jgi:hypothetical protein
LLSIPLTPLPALLDATHHRAGGWRGLGLILTVLLLHVLIDMPVRWVLTCVHFSLRRSCHSPSGSPRARPPLDEDASDDVGGNWDGLYPLVCWAID